MRAWRNLGHFSLLIAIGLGAFPAAALGGPRWRAAAERFEQLHPGVRLIERDSGISRVYGRPFSTGATAEDAVESFLARHTGMFGVSPDQLVPGSLLPDGARTRPVMYQPDSGRYKFTLVYFRQQVDGIPVYGSDLRLLVRNEPSNPLVWAGSSLHDLGTFGIDPIRRERVGRAEFVEERFESGKLAVRQSAPDVVNFSPARVVIWAGVDDAQVEPRLALAFVADDSSPGRAARSKFLYLTDLESGKILHQEDQIIREISGSVSGLATEGAGAEHCENEVATPMPFIDVSNGVGTVQADANGDFVIPGTAVRVDASPEGLFFDVRDFLGPLTTASAAAPFQVLLNADNDDELVRAQVNGYVEANRVRDFAARFNPDYPTFTDTGIPVWVNRTDGFCPGNAWYSPGDPGSPTGYSINFCRSATNRPNTAYSSVVHHEFGHHLVSAGGSGQGQYGEGMGDVMSTLILDDPRLGIGFFGNCDGNLRNAANSLQYPCSGAIHYCGQLISAAVWSTRNKLIVEHPDDYIDILAGPAVNAILLHNGSFITPSITVDYLTLDDDDADLLNGTPHYDEINAGFSAHNMAGPALATGLRITPDASLVATKSDGVFSPDSIVYTLENREATPVDFSVTGLEPWITVTGGSGTLAPGAAAEVTVALNSDVDQLANGLHRGTVFFVNETDHDGDLQREVLVVNGGTPFDSTDVPQFISLFATATSTIGIDDAFCVGDVNASVDITHVDISELTVELTGASGTSIRLHGPGSDSGANLVRTYDEEAGVPAAGPGSLSDFNGESSNGTWTLSVSDNFLPNNGNLNAWSLKILPCAPTAAPVDVTVVKTLPSTIALDAQSAVGLPLVHVIASLPSQGRLFDPNGGEITSVPYALLAGGDSVVFDPENVFAGRDGFSYKAFDGQDSNLAEVAIHVGERRVIQAVALDLDPGWTTTGQWAFGQPTGQGSKGRDPGAGYTGTNVYGYNLSGDYGGHLAEMPLTSGAMDCSGFESIEVSFRRWLGVEVAPYDHARFDASNDGTNWVTIWEHQGPTIDESDWSLQTYDISEVADNQPTVFLRWVMGGTDGSETYQGWNIDDVELSGVVPVARVDVSMTKTDLSWAAQTDALFYDVVRGDLATLRSSGGDFELASQSCLGDDLIETNLLGLADPGPGEDYWILVRAVAAPGSNLSYESFGEGQTGERDAEIDSAIGSCP